MVPGARVHQVRKRAHGPLPCRRHRPSDAAQRDALHPGDGQGKGGRVREEAPRVDGQGDHRRADERGEEGLRLPDPALGAQVLEGGGRGPARPPAEQEPEAVRVHGARVHVGRDTQGARRPGAPDSVDRQAKLDRDRDARLPTAARNELGAAARAQPRGGVPHDDDRPSRHPDALRHPGARPGRRRLLRPEQAEQQPGAVQPQAPREPHGLRRRQAGVRQVLQREARDREYDPGLPRGRDHHPRPCRRVQPRSDGQRWRVDTLRAGCGHAPEPLRPLRRGAPVHGGADGIQDRRLPGALVGDDGGRVPGPARGGQVHHQPLRRARVRALR